MQKGVVSGLESDSDEDENVHWSYVWPKDLVRYFLKINNQTSPIAEKYNELRVKPLKKAQKKIETAQLKNWFAQRTGTEEYKVQKSNDLTSL